MGDLLDFSELLSRGVTNSLSPLRLVQSSNIAPEEAMAAQATLRWREWEHVDERVNDVLRERLTIVDDLRSAGLIQPIGLGEVLRVTERFGDFSDADIAYDGDTSPTADRPSFGRDIIPVPIISKDFKVGWRQLEQSRGRGTPLDTMGAELAARKVRDRLEELIVNGYSGGLDGHPIPGLLTAANRITVNLSNAWDSGGATVVNDVQAMLAAAYLNNLFGPFMLYLPKNYWATVQGDYSTLKGDRTYMERIDAFSEIQGIRTLATLPDDNVLLVQLTRDVIDLSEAQGITTVQWEKNPFLTNFRVLTVAGPQIKSMLNSNGDTIHGIVHLRAP